MLIFPTNSSVDLLRVAGVRAAGTFERGDRGWPIYSSNMGVSKNNGTPKSSILIGFSIINHPFLGPTPIFGNTHIMKCHQRLKVHVW